MQPRAHLLQPAGVRNIAAADDVHALELRPARKLFERQLFTGGAGKVRMDVQIGDEFHDTTRLEFGPQYNTDGADYQKSRFSQKPRFR